MTTRDDVDAINNEYAQALADRDVDGMIGLRTHAARLCFSDTPMLQGHQAVAAVYDKALKDGPITIKFDSVDVFEDGDLVVDVGPLLIRHRAGKVRRCLSAPARRNTENPRRSGHHRRTSPTRLTLDYSRVQGMTPRSPDMPYPPSLQSLNVR